MGKYKIISTHHNTYILDEPDLGGTYTERRIKLLAKKEELPLKIYPLKERYTSLQQLANTKYRIFIDDAGDLVKYTPNTWVTVEYCKVLRADRTWRGNWLITSKLPVKFVVEEVPAYIGYFNVGGAYFLYSLEEEMKSPSRKKV
ncbi:hypothetical protein [Vibrio phage JSF12]|nr:hypothetical protein FDI98_gp084 [Vibrio phage JSF10]YP_009794816.1 hypothetical protein HOS35_gp133 [Vibrio phage JSF12]ASV43448.1 hypothetical protein [Vibrio phage JSF10]ASV43651.1 hypothetical protein [Vibrio phage JSF12]